MYNMHLSWFLSKMASAGLLLIYYFNNSHMFSFFHKGTTFQLPNKETIMSKVYLVSGIFDLPAKSLVLEEIQFNGFCGCSYCVEAGKSVKAKNGGRGQVHVYPFND